MNRRKSTFLSIGIPSMFVIFSVLCMVILALLTLGTSRQDLQTAQISLQQTSDYYSACTKASTIYAEITKYAMQTVSAADDEAAYLSEMENITGHFSDIPVTWNQKSQTASFTLNYTDSQGLYVEIQLSYPSGNSGLTPEILTWKTVSTGTWNPDTSQPVYKGENS